MNLDTVLFGILLIISIAMFVIMQKLKQAVHAEIAQNEEHINQLETDNQRLRDEAKRISRIEDHKTRHEQMDALIAGVTDVSP